LSGYPGNQLPKVPVWQFDKLIHTTVYSILSVCFLLPYKQQYLQTSNRFKIGLIVLLIGAFYGGFMEILQHYIFINRSGNWYDFIANLMGSIIGVLLFPFIVKIIPKNKW
jgi:VanZ family protein